jgi:hypothetical protein
VPTPPKVSAKLKFTPEQNRVNQLEATRLKKEAAKKLAEQEKLKQQQTESERKKTIAKQQDEDLKRAEANRKKKRLKDEANALRKSQIEAAVKDAISVDKLNAMKAWEIGQAEIEREAGTENTAKVKFQQALVVQQDPPLDRWRFKLGINAYKILHKNGSGGTFTDYNGLVVHLTFDTDSVQAPGSIAGKTADQLVVGLLSVVRDKRIHATLETGAKVQPHYFYGDNIVGGMNLAERQHLKTVLDAYILSDIKPRVQDAINSAGDI